MSAAGTTKAYMCELRDVIAELKTLNNRAKLLRERKKELLTQVLEYVEYNELPGIQYQDLQVLKVETTTHTRKKKKEKEQSIIEVLEKLNISDTKSALSELNNAMIGEEKQSNTLRVKSVIPQLL